MQRILIVEDDIEIQDMLRNYLTDAGYEVVLASDGVTGIAKFDDTINLVLLDIMLPKIDGYGVVVVVPVWAVRGGVLYAGRRIIDLIFRREGVRMEGVSRNDEVVSTDFCLEQE